MTLHAVVERSHAPISDAALAQIFTEARTHNGFLDKPVADELLRQAVDIAKIGPTSANQSPMRLVFVKSRAAKERLRPALAPGNLDKTMAAPVTAITAYDVKFYDHLPFLMPHADAKSWFDKLPAEQVREVAHKNGTLQVAYLIIALRALGLDTGPMTGFDNAKLDAEFFPDGRFKSNVLINIGYGDHTKLFPRSPRFDFDEIAKIV
jgi:3-hydroxypropanoate dehydrogenase